MPAYLGTLGEIGEEGLYDNAATYWPTNEGFWNPSRPKRQTSEHIEVELNKQDMLTYNNSAAW